MCGRTPKNGQDFLVQRTDSAGAVMWAKSYGGPGSDIGTCAIKTRGDSGYAVVGYTSSFGAAVSDILFIKLDKAGSVVWQKTYGSPAQDHAYSVIQTLDGGYAIAGATWGYSSGSDAWVIKTDNLGNVQWQNLYGGNGGIGPHGFQYARSIVQTPDSGYVVCGNTNYLGGANSNDAYVFRIDKYGSAQWQYAYGTDSTETCHTIIKTRDNNYVICGQSDATGVNWLWMAKIGAQGNILWKKTYGSKAVSVGSNSDNGAPQSVQQTSDGGFAAACYTGPAPFKQTYDNELWLVKTDSMGSMQWQEGFNVQNGTNFTVMQASDRGYMLPGNSGTSFKTDSVGNAGISCQARDSVQQVRFNALSVISVTNVVVFSSVVVSNASVTVTDLAINATDYCAEIGGIGPAPAQSVRVYPNPSNGQASIEVESESKVTVTNYLGQTISSTTISGKGTISLGEPGVFIVSVTDKAGHTYSTKLINQ
jgi:hypothetical protein